jgi:diaminohydroxyphosphoribosylaminopyrimidine deaminase/5-amino-6-(5-phosphoribosylamino)uracil reductase
MFTAAEERGMRRALDLAALGGRKAFPNPLVGAVVIGGNSIIAEGFHACCGAPHAEVIALESAGNGAGKATLVVSLEPCCHTGRTGPCVREIISSGITRVVAAMQDPDPRVSGKGFAALRAAGIDVETGLMEAEARSLNRAYLHYRETGRSLLRLKMAVTLDGMVAASDGSSRWITGEQARARVREMRAASSAILVGAGTVRADDPSLMPGPDRPEGGFPSRMVVSRTGHLDTGARIFDGTAPLIIVLPYGACPGSAETLRRAGAEIWEIPSSSGGVDLRLLLETAASRGLGGILCEGGAGLATSLIREELVDEVAIFVAPALLGGEGLRLTGELDIGTISQAIRLTGVEFTPVGEDVLVEGRIVHGSR